MARNLTCPNCGTSIDVDSSMEQSIREEFRQKYQTSLQEARAKLDKEKEEQQQRIASEKQKLERESQDLKLLIAQLQNQQYEQEQKIAIEKEKYLAEKRREIERIAREQTLLQAQQQQEQEKEKLRVEFELRLREKEQQLEQVKRTADEMSRKANQSSMQLQGEVQELMLESWLSENFPQDGIEEVPKGVKGADCIQIIKDKQGNTCGKIVYESKRTKSFSMEWIEKLKADMQTLGAFVGVIVTQAMTEDIKKQRNQSGIWICQIHELPLLIPVLRQMLVKLHASQSSEKDKTDKMQMLYDYMMGEAFRTSLENISRTFRRMKEQILAERSSMERIWKARETELDRAFLSADRIIGDIDGIASSGNVLDYFKNALLEDGE